MKKKRLGRLIKVTWSDSAGATSNWQWSEDFKLRPYKMVSVGFVWKETKKMIAIAPHIEDHSESGEIEQACGVMVIPKHAIIRIDKLRNHGEKRSEEPTSNPPANDGNLSTHSRGR